MGGFFFNLRNLLVEKFPFYLSGFWAGTVETVPTKLMTKNVGTDLSVPGLTRSSVLHYLSIVKGRN